MIINPLKSNQLPESLSEKVTKIPQKSYYFEEISCTARSPVNSDQEIGFVSVERLKYLTGEVLDRIKIFHNKEGLTPTLKPNNMPLF
ncbi:hypothetical protein TNCV_1026451 [Trichonephila clavipes]|nr:hypothetical protein TNCV_1026451 [Trichonephila clavipes]